MKVLRKGYEILKQKKEIFNPFRLFFALEFHTLSQILILWVLKITNWIFNFNSKNSSDFQYLQKQCKFHLLRIGFLFRASVLFFICSLRFCNCFYDNLMPDVIRKEILECYKIDSNENDKALAYRKSNHHRFSSK